MDDRLLPFRVRLHRNDVQERDAVERPIVTGGGVPQLPLGFGQRDIQAALAGSRAFEQELQRQRRLSRAGRAFDEVEVLAHQPAKQDGIQPGNAGTRQRWHWSLTVHTHLVSPPQS